MTKCGMVGEHCEVPPLEIHAPFDESMHNGQGFFLMGHVVSFMGVHLARGECNRLGSLALILHEDSSYCKVGSICGHRKGQVWIWNAEDWSCDHSCLQFFKRLFGLCGPFEWNVLVGKIRHGCCNLGVAFDESSVIVA